MLFSFQGQCAYYLPRREEFIVYGLLMVEVETEDQRNGFCRRRLRVTNTKVTYNESRMYRLIYNAARPKEKKHLPLIHFDTCFTFYGFNLLPFHMKWLQLLFKLTFGLIALTTEWWNSQHLPFPFQGMGREIYPLKWNGSSWYDEVYYTRTTTNRQWTNRHSLQVIRHPWQTTSETASSMLGVSLESSVQVIRLKLCCTEYA